jgi:hypothetical protein
MVGYSGNKDKRAVPPPVKRYNYIYDLFAGGLGYSRAALRVAAKAKVIAAESNPVQRRLLECLRNRPDEIAFRQAVLEHATEVAEALKRSLHPGWNGQGKYGEQFPEHRHILKSIWDELVKEPFDLALSTGIADVEAVAAQILVLSYGYGSSVRTSANGLNVPPSAQKIKVQNVKLPIAINNLQAIHSDYRHLLASMCHRRAVALIDPMYVLPPEMRESHRKLTKCYPDHEPYGKKHWDDYWTSISGCMQKFVETIVVAGYYSDKLDGGIYSLAAHYGYSVELIKHGALQAQNKHKHGLKHGKRADTLRGAHCAMLFSAVWSAQHGLCPKIMLSIARQIDLEKLKPVDCEWFLRRKQPLAGQQLEIEAA